MDEVTLRIELENELKNKKQCTYQAYECTQLCIDGYKYCCKHILQDKNAPYKQCSFIYSSNGKRCHLAAPRSDKKDYGYCSEHALKTTLARNRQSAKHPLPYTAEVLLHSLSHYVKKPRIRSNSSSTQHSDDGDRNTPDSEQKSSKYLDPFVDFDASVLYNEKCNNVLDVCSESESDIEASTFSSVWQDAQADSSDDESIDSDYEDILKHANVYTAEEVTIMTRDKLVRLQSLYIEQYRHLQYLLTKKRRKYLHSLKREKETCCNIYNQVRDNPKEQRLYKKLKALNNYQKCHGVDAILSKRLRDLRVKVTDGTSKSQIFSKCVFTEGGVKCGERSLPLAKHCQKHILEDPNQVLFRACGKVTADVECPTPITAIFDDSTCPLHLEIPFLRSYNPIRKDSESDADETTDIHLNFHQSSTQLTDNIKTELINYEIPPEIPKMESLPTMLFEETPQNASETITPNFSNTTENQNFMEETANNGDSSMEISTAVDDEISLNSEIIDEKMDVNEDTVEDTKDDIDVTGNVDLGVVEENDENNFNVVENTSSTEVDTKNVENETNLPENQDNKPDVQDSTEDTHIKSEIPDSNVDIYNQTDMQDSTADTYNNPDIDTYNKPDIVDSHSHMHNKPDIRDSTPYTYNISDMRDSSLDCYNKADMGDSAVDTLLRAAEMISDQDNKKNAEMLSANRSHTDAVTESTLKESLIVTDDSQQVIEQITSEMEKNESETVDK